MEHIACGWKDIQAYKNAIHNPHLKRLFKLKKKNPQETKQNKKEKKNQDSKIDNNEER